MPSTEASKYSINLCKKIELETSVNFSLDGVNNFSHITIFQLVIPKENLDKVIEVLESTVKEIPVQEMRFTNFGCHFGFVEADFELTEELKDAQLKIVNSVNDLREGESVIKVWNRNTDHYSKEALYNASNYGFDNLFEIYNPHLSITCLSDFEKAKDYTQKLAWPFKEFTSETVGLYLLGEYGTCTTLIREFNLKKAD